MAQRHSGFKKVKNEWFVEPSWTIGLLFDWVSFPAGLHDPCVGTGTIVHAATARGLHATGADLIERSGGRFAVCDYLTDTRIYPNIVTNPPFSKAPAIIRHALDHVPDGGRVAVFSSDSFLYSQVRYSLFRRPETELVLILSRRPSAPPGDKLLEHGESFRGNGSFNFAWVVFRRGRSPGLPHIDWALAELGYDPLED